MLFRLAPPLKSSRLTHWSSGRHAWKKKNPISKTCILETLFLYGHDPKLLAKGQRLGCRLSSKLRTKPGSRDRPEPSPVYVAWPPGGLSGLAWGQDPWRLTPTGEWTDTGAEQASHFDIAATFTSMLTFSDSPIAFSVCERETFHFSWIWRNEPEFIALKSEQTTS